MAVEVTNNQAVFGRYIKELQGKTLVYRAVKIENGDDRVVNCDVDSMNFSLLISVHFEISGWDCF